MTAFVGLGNPGPEYARTKHNFGFWVVEALADRKGLSFRSTGSQFLYAVTPDKRAVFAKPVTGMNRSGTPIVALCDKWSLSPADLVVVVDDVDLPLGAVRIRPKGGDGCHRGLASVIAALGSTDFPRMRMGIATEEILRPAEDYVLRPFRRKDEARALEAVGRGADAAESILAIGLEKTMARFNRMKTEAHTERKERQWN